MPFGTGRKPLTARAASRFDSALGSAYTVASMWRRVAIVALGMAVMTASLLVCPRGAMACQTVMSANHTCCGQGVSLRANNCCRGRQAPDSGFPAGLTAERHQQHRLPGFNPVPLAAAPSPCVPAVAGTHNRGTLTPNAPPPQTLFTQHTALLL